jgi:hypothetical protein
MHGLGLDLDVRDWFDDMPRRQRPPRSTVDPDFVRNALDA